MPSAPPNSKLVSEIADAAPARSGGAEPTIRSVVSVPTGAKPRQRTTRPVVTSKGLLVVSTWVQMAKPMAVRTKPAAIRLEAA
ncbi:hypothetical protein D3C72_2440030 [compost metagenome]